MNCVCMFQVIYSYCRHGLPVFKNLVNLSFGSKNKRGWRLLANLLKQSTKLETLIVKVSSIRKTDEQLCNTDLVVDHLHISF